MGILGIEGGRIRVTILVGGGDADHARWIGTGVVDEDQIALFHLIPHGVASLMVSDAIPFGRAITLEIVDGTGV